MVAVFRALGEADILIPYYLSSQDKSLYRRVLSNAYSRQRLPKHSAAATPRRLARAISGWSADTAIGRWQVGRRIKIHAAIQNVGH
jgi:hypothetical protein